MQMIQKMEIQFLQISKREGTLPGAVSLCCLQNVKCDPVAFRLNPTGALKAALIQPDGVLDVVIFQLQPGIGAGKNLGEVGFGFANPVF